MARRSAKKGAPKKTVMRTPFKNAIMKGRGKY